MKVGTIHTLYGRRSGAELLTEKMICGMVEHFDDISFVVYCNEEAFHTLPDHMDRLEKCLVPALTNQYLKVLWLETIAAGTVNRAELDVFWIPSGTNSFPGRWITPTVVTFMDLGEYFVKGKYDFKRTIFRKRFCVPISLKRGRKFTTISHTTTNDLKCLFGVDSRIVYPGFSPRAISNLREPAEDLILRETSVNLKKIIFTPGRTDFIGKGLDVLLQAYQKLLQVVDNVPPLVLVGPQGEGHARLMDEIIRLGLSKNVYWLGRVSDECVDALYSISEYVVFASRYEGFGFPVLEAMQRNVPLVCSDAGSLVEVAGDAAYVVAAGDAESLANAMLLLHEDAKLRQTLIDKGSERIRTSYFDWHVAYECMRKTFDECITAFEEEKI